MSDIYAIPGIRTKVDRQQWTHAFASFGRARGLDVETHAYHTSIWPYTNFHKVLPREAKSLSLRALSGEACPDFVAHSFGTNVTVGTVKLLSKHRVQAGKLILIGSSLHSDVEKSGLLALAEEGAFTHAVALYSKGDRILKNRERFPGYYGSLGYKGFRNVPSEFAFMFESIDMSPFGHNEYFTNTNIYDTFSLVTSLLDEPAFD